MEEGDSAAPSFVVAVVIVCKKVCRSKKGDAHRVTLTGFELETASYFVLCSLSMVVK